jgi:NhaP-type Na+/H+ or K+/H+ antiporter
VQDLSHAEIVGITLSLALVVGVVAQSIARHLKIPGIVLLLSAGVLLGPDVLGWLNPAALGSGLHILVGFAVAVILFEGGMNLNLSRLKREARVIRSLLSMGAVVTAGGASLYAYLLMGWNYKICFLFGTLMIVTGPTVVTPLLRRIKVRRNIETILEGEGVLIDAIGAVVAAAWFHIATTASHFDHNDYFKAVSDIGTHLGFGLMLGGAGGYLIAILLRQHKVIPAGLENIFTLAAVLALFQFSNATMPESGIMAVSMAGIVVGNMGTRVQRELHSFKEQLTVMLIGLLFVLLAADVRMADVMALGWAGVATVATLMLVVRPLSIAICTNGSDLTLREKLFLSWLSPRGIVAAAVASLFAQSLAEQGNPIGNDLRALVFMVIAGTVVIQGMTGGLVARFLGLRRPVNRGFIIFGANEIGQAIGQILRARGEPVLYLDRDPRAIKAVEEQGFRAIFGNGLEERTLQRAQVDERRAVLSLVFNEEVSLLFTRRVNEEFKGPAVYVAMRHGEVGVTPEMVERAGAKILFGGPREIELWATRLRRGWAVVEAWELEDKDSLAEFPSERDLIDIPEELLMPLMIERAGKLTPAYQGHSIKIGDVVHVALFSEKLGEARSWLLDRGWSVFESEEEPAAPPESESPAQPGPEPEAAMPAGRGGDEGPGALIDLDRAETG